MVTQTASVLVRPVIQVAPSQSKIQGRNITTKVVGVTFEDRQEIIARLQIGDHVWLEQEPDNAFDANAIMVTRSNGEQLGYLNRHLAANLVPYFEKYGKPMVGKVRLITGSAYDGYSLGVVISFRIPKMTHNHANHRKHQFADWEED